MCVDEFLGVREAGFGRSISEHSGDFSDALLMVQRSDADGCLLLLVFDDLEMLVCSSRHLRKMCNAEGLAIVLVFSTQLSEEVADAMGGLTANSRIHFIKDPGHRRVFIANRQH